MFSIHSIIQIYNKWRNRMARPKTIELENGTVSLQGFPKEVSDKLATYIKQFEEAVVIVPTGTPLPTVDETPGPLPSKALGVYENGNDVRLVTVAYNVDNHQARVVNVEQLENKRSSSTKFKMAALREKFV